MFVDGADRLFVRFPVNILAGAVVSAAHLTLDAFLPLADQTIQITAYNGGHNATAPTNQTANTHIRRVIEVSFNRMRRAEFQQVDELKGTRAENSIQPAGISSGGATS